MLTVVCGFRGALVNGHALRGEHCKALSAKKPLDVSGYCSLSGNVTSGLVQDACNVLYIISE